MPELFVTNFNRNYTGVSSTAAGVIRQQMSQYDLRLVGHSLPGAPDPISRRDARRLSRDAPEGRSFAIWHVRRNPEMQTAIWARDVLRLPIRIVFTSAAQRLHSAFPRWLISRMDAVIATTDKAAEFVPHVRAVVPHGVDTSLFVPAPDRTAAWAATGYPGQRGIATIGRIRPEKGTDVFIDAAIAALPDLPGVTALVIGKATSKHEKFLADQKARIAAAGLADRILFPGELAPERMVDLLPALDLCVQLPRYEGYGMAPLEAMASGVPLLASEAGYFRHFTQGGANGITVPVEAAPQAAEALVTLLSDPARLAQMAVHARQDASRLFSIDREAQGIAEVYEALWRG
ncbi:glycosyltransferase family 4 protein [Pseudooceanicola onchidii]|uniref:glycosyltransferase family 4 protein n=1 Tax=Pseudooceanicola onchidii TaxID=2562279 RepID=UPI0010AB0656|nr:glycosyltransferase family 4 protein [Pseudooceanicola onchidii]